MKKSENSIGLPWIALLDAEKQLSQTSKIVMKLFSINNILPSQTIHQVYKGSENIST
jgi:hypothetical protein